MPLLKSILEAALLAAAESVPIDRLAALFDDEQRPSRDAIRAALLELAGDYEGHGMELVEVAGGFRVQIPQSFAPWVSRLWEERAARYSRALLETLALMPIVSRSPVAKSRKWGGQRQQQQSPNPAGKRLD